MKRNGLVILVNQDLYNDGYIRTFRGIPEMNRAVKEMIRDYVNLKRYEAIMLFFTVKCGFDQKYSEFLLREAIRGNIC